MAIRLPGWPKGFSISCFGYVDGRFYGGQRHHMAIMQFILSHGYDFESLMNADQAWGWILNAYCPPDMIDEGPIQYRLSTDAAAINPELAPQIESAIHAITGKPAELKYTYEPSNSNYAPRYEQYYGVGGTYESDGLSVIYIVDSRTGWQGLVPATSSDQFPPPEKNPVPSPGGVLPPPKKAWREDMWKESRTKFVYDAQTGKLLASDDWKVHHPDLLEQMGMDDLYIDRLLAGGMNDVPRYLFGEHYPGESPAIWNDSGKVPPQYIDAANKAYMKYLNQREASVEDGRYVWLINFKGQLEIGVPGQHHVDLGWGADEIASGDILVNTDLTGKPKPGQTTLRVLTLDYNYDWNGVVDRVEQEWDQRHPGQEITNFENLAAHPEAWYEDPDDQWEGLTNHASYDIIGGMAHSMFHKKSFDQTDSFYDPEGNNWKLYQMESGEYKNHHAIMVDNNKHRLFINYHGHHGPMMEAGMNSGIPGGDFYNTVQGHYRLEASNDEPFVEGWGFHHGSLKPWQEEVFEQALRKYHDVDDLQKAWVNFKEATVKWLGHVVGKAWKALYDREDAILYMWSPDQFTNEESAVWLNSAIGKEAFFKNGNIKKAGQYTQAEGTYTTVSFILPTGAKDIEKEKAKVKELLEKTLTEKWPTVNKETHFKPIPQRFMVKKSGEIIMGEYKSHYDLICDYLNKEAAEKYTNYETHLPDYPFMAGGFLDDCGIIRLIHTQGEPDYDPKKIAKLVIDDAKENLDYVTGMVRYEDWRDPGKPTTMFTIK